MPKVTFGEPSELIAGDTWRWDLKVSDYPPSAGWTLTYAFGGEGQLPDIEATTSPDGDWFRLSVPPAETDTIEGGAYDFSVHVSDGTDRYTIRQGIIQVIPNIAERAQTRSHVLKVLNAVEAAIEGRLTRDMESFQINGRAVNHIPIEQLRKIRGEYLSKLWRLMGRNDGKLGRTVGVRFGRAS